MMRLVGLFVPAAGELIEVGYQFDDHFEVDWSDYHGTFGGSASGLQDALAETLAWWQGDLGIAAKPLEAA